MMGLEAFPHQSFTRPTTKRTATYAVECSSAADAGEIVRRRSGSYSVAILVFGSWNEAVSPRPPAVCHLRMGWGQALAGDRGRVASGAERPHQALIRDVANRSSRPQRVTIATTSGIGQL